MPFCAICTADLASSHLRLAPLGRGDAMVNVCDVCFDERPIARCDDRGAYEPPPVSTVNGGGGGLRVLFMQGAERAMPDYARRAQADFDQSMMPMYVGLDDGHVLVRVPRRDDKGRRRDQQRAFEYAVSLYPGQLISSVGHSARYFLFQRPDPKVLAKAKAQRDDHRDPLAALHAMQRHGSRR